MEDEASTLQQALEALAGNAYNPDLAQLQDEPSNTAPTSTSTEPMSTTIHRWQNLFTLSADDAITQIMQHRTNLTRTRVSDTHWMMIREEQEARGYDREAYEYEIEVQRRSASWSSLLPTSSADRSTTKPLTYLIEMNGPLDDVGKVQRAAGMDEPPVVVKGESVEDGRAVSLCCIDEAGKTRLLQWVVREGKGFEPTILVNPKSMR